MFKNNRILILGIFLAAIDAFMIAGMSLFSKLLSQYFGPVEITFFRNIVSLSILLILILGSRNLNVFKTKRPFAHLFRSIIGTIGIVMGAWALSMMPLAETTVLLFTGPLFVVLLSYPILKEPVGIYRISAVLVGFIGILIMANPTSGIQALPMLGIILGLCWGFFAGAVNICLRWMGKTEQSTTTVFYFLALGMIMTSFHWPVAEVKPGGFSMDAFWIILGLGVTGLLSLLAKTQAHRLVEASIAAPILYSMIIWTMLFDYMFWDKTPSINVIAGASLIIISNLFIIYRETRFKARGRNIGLTNSEPRG